MRLARLNMPTSSPKRDMFFTGINRNEFMQDSEIKAGVNLSSQNLPALSPRLPREEMYPLARLTTPKHIFTAGGKLCWVDGNSFYYDGVSKGTVDGAKHKSMVDFNGYVIIFPDNAYYCYDTLNPEFGVFGKFGVGDCEDVSAFDEIASTIEASVTQFKFGAKSIKCVSTAGSGQFGCRTNNYSFAIDPTKYYVATAYVYGTGNARVDIYRGSDGDTKVGSSVVTALTGEWTRIPAFVLPANLTGETHIMIEVTMESTKIGDIFYVDGIMQTSITEKDFTDRVWENVNWLATHPFMPMPAIDFGASFMNRLFGGKGSSVYASAWGDFKTWSKFEGTNQDSWATDVTTEGDFTGVFTYSNHVTYFKDNWTDELYGTLPRNFSMLSMSGYGAISNDAIAEGGGYLMFADATGIYIYSGGTPTPVGEPLNEKNYTDVKIESDGERFYVLIVRSVNDRKLYVYDIQKRVWIPEDSLNIVSMTSLNKKVYALDSAGKIWKFNSGTETITWEAETKVFDDSAFEKKKTKNIKLRLKMEAGATISVYSKKNDGSYVLEHTVTNSTGAEDYLVVRKVVNVNRSERYQLKFTGVGNSIVYGQREFDIGSQF